MERLLLARAKVEIWVLSPSSARKIITKVEAISLALRNMSLQPP
jgi:hypothetical protein